MYQMPYALPGSEAPQAIIRVADRAWIPFDPANTDYQQYLAWLAEGNEPLPPEGEA